MNLTPTETLQLRIAIAEEMGWKSGKDSHPPYTTSIDAIREACLERFKNKVDRDEMTYQIRWYGIQQRNLLEVWQLDAIDWCIAFARTAKIWRFKE